MLLLALIPLGIFALFLPAKSEPVIKQAEIAPKMVLTQTIREIDRGMRSFEDRWSIEKYKMPVLPKPEFPHILAPSHPVPRPRPAPDVVREETMHTAPSGPLRTPAFQLDDLAWNPRSPRPSTSHRWPVARTATGAWFWRGREDLPGHMSQW